MSYTQLKKLSIVSLVVLSSSMLFPVNAASKYSEKIEEIAKTPKVKKALEHIVKQREQNIEDLITLTEIEAPPFNEQNRAKQFVKMLMQEGLTDVNIDEVGNVIGRRPGLTGSKTIALGAHMDTVFPEGTDVKVRKNGNVYTSPGIGDNTRGMVLLLSLLRTLNEQDIQTQEDILFIGTVGEEGLGDLRGVKHLFRKGGDKIDTFIGIDGGSNERLIYGAVGSHRYRVTFKGPGGHSWGSFGMANPHHALGRAIAKFSSRAPSVTNEGPKSSFSIGRIGGGTSINSIPFESWMEVDMRSGDQSRLDAVDSIFQQAMIDGLNEENESRKRGPELTVEVKQVGQRPAGLGNENSSLVQHGKAAMKHLGIEASLSVSSTDANIPISLGIPAITMSRGGVSSKAHSPAESWEDKDSHIAIQTALLLVLAEAEMVR